MDLTAGGAARARRTRGASPDRGRRPCLEAAVVPARRVQVVYYLCRNGQLEQPHFMELTQLPHQLLRLRDVLNRLTVLRGRGMPSLFSWSCKRSYKNGYVWNDLAENDVIFPADGCEYILKGSELLEGSSSDRLRQLQLVPHRTGKPLLGRQLDRCPMEEPGDDVLDDEVGDDEQETEELERAEDDKSWRRGRARNGTLRCSRGVSTEDEVAGGSHGCKARSNVHTELVLDADASPPSSSSSERAAHPRATAVAAGADPAGRGSSRFDDAEAAEEPAAGPQTRGSILLHLIACGTSVAAKARGGASKSYASAEAPPSSSVSSTPNTSGRKSAGSLHRGVLRRAAAATAVAEEDEEEISCMSENPRFGNLQREDKEYFSGSIVESIRESRGTTPGPCLKKSTSYNEERSSKCGLGEVFDGGEEDPPERCAKAKCIPTRARAAACIRRTPPPQQPK